MTPTDEKPGAEREQTDDSLRTEREKTDRAIAVDPVTTGRDEAKPQHADDLAVREGEARVGDGRRMYPAQVVEEMMLEVLHAEGSRSTLKVARAWALKESVADLYPH